MKKSKKKGCLISALIVGIIIFGTVVLIITLNSSKSPSQSDSLNSTRSEFAVLLDITDEQESTITEIFENCGIGKITKSSLVQSGEYRTSYYINDAETAAYGFPIVIWISNDNKTIDEIFYRDYDIYVDGEIVGLVTSYYVNQLRREQIMLATQILIKECLSFPLTAEFKALSGWAFDIQDGNISTQSSVISQNTFGVKYEADFQVTYDIFANPISLILDGEEYIK